MNAPNIAVAGQHGRYNVPVVGVQIEPGGLPRSQESVRRRLLARYLRDEGPVGAVIAATWCLIAVALAVLLVVYDVVQLMYGHRGAESVGLTVFVVALLWLLSIVEGSELAVARLLGTDPQSLPHPSAGRTLDEVQRHPKAFFNGRQALVVTSIVAMTLSVAQIARLPSGTGIGAVTILRSWFAHAALIFGFPNFMVLWISQLYPKLRAASDAPGRFMLPSYQLVVRGCMWLERATRLGAPTSILGIVRDRTLLTGAAPEAVSMEASHVSSRVSDHP